MRGRVLFQLLRRNMKAWQRGEGRKTKPCLCDDSSGTQPTASDAAREPPQRGRSDRDREGPSVGERAGQARLKSFSSAAVGELHAESRRVADHQLAVLRHGSPLNSLPKTGMIGPSVRAGGHIFAEGRVRLDCDEMIGVGPAAMRDDRQVVGRGMGGDRSSSVRPPTHITSGCRMSMRALLDQAAEAVAGIFVLAGRPFDVVGCACLSTR